jgi:hypothetical protein
LNARCCHITESGGIIAIERVSLLRTPASSAVVCANLCYFDIDNGDYGKTRTNRVADFSRPPCLTVRGAAK